MFDLDRDYALRHLGRGLHALQDIFAHGNVTGGRGGTHTWWHDDIRYNWADSTFTTIVRSGQSHGQRFFDTRDATLNHFNRFFAGVGMPASGTSSVIGASVVGVSAVGVPAARVPTAGIVGVGGLGVGHFGLGSIGIEPF